MDDYLPIKSGMFHSYVSLPEAMYNFVYTAHI